MYINKGQIQNELTKMEESFNFLHSIIYDNAKAFNSISKGEQIAIFDIMQDVTRYRNGLQRYMDYFGENTSNNN